MKKFLRYSGICALLLALDAFILMMATPAIVGTNSDFAVKGTIAVFGGSEKIFGALAVTYSPSALALIGWILGLVGLIIVLCGVVLPLLKVNALVKFAGLLNLIAVICFVIAGIFMFIVIPTWFGANNMDVPDNVAIGAGWIIGAILYIAAGVVAILPAAADFMAKKK